MSNLLDALLSAAEAAGNVVDAPAGVVRNLFAGQNPLPGIFDPKKRATGRDILKQWGVAGENRPGLDAGDVGSFAVETLLDPLNLLGVGLLGKAFKARKAMKMANALTPTPELLTFSKRVVHPHAPALAALSTLLAQNALAHQSRKNTLDQTVGTEPILNQRLSAPSNIAY